MEDFKKEIAEVVAIFNNNKDSYTGGIQYGILLGMRTMLDLDIKEDYEKFDYISDVIFSLC